MKRLTIFIGLAIIPTVIVAVVILSVKNREENANSTAHQLPHALFINEHQGQQWYFAFSPDSKILACYNSNDGRSDEIVAWEVATGGKLKTISDASFRTMAFSPNDKTLATRDRNSNVRLWNTTTWNDNAKHVVDSNGGPLFWVGHHQLGLWSPQGLSIYTLATEATKRFPIKTASPEEISITSDKKLVAAVNTMDRSVDTWCIPSGKLQWSFVAHLDNYAGGAPLCVRFAPDSKTLASGGYDHIVLLSDVIAKEHVRLLKVIRSPITAIAFSLDGHLLAAGDGAMPELSCEVTVWNMDNGQSLGRWKTKAGVRQLEFSPDGQTLAVGTMHEKGFVELWSVKKILDRHE